MASLFARFTKASDVVPTWKDKSVKFVTTVSSVPSSTGMPGIVTLAEVSCNKFRYSESNIAVYFPSVSALAVKM